MAPRRAGSCRDSYLVLNTHDRADAFHVVRPPSRSVMPTERTRRPAWAATLGHTGRMRVLSSRPSEPVRRRDWTETAGKLEELLTPPQCGSTVG
jgi:hypothetical protein